jgi:hypothetical protein
MTIAEWDAYIASAPNFATAQNRMEEAVAAGVDFSALLDEQAKRA